MKGRLLAARESLSLSMEGVLERNKVCLLKVRVEAVSVWPQRKRIRIAHVPSPLSASLCSFARVDGRTSTFLLLHGGPLPCDSVSELWSPAEGSPPPLF